MKNLFLILFALVCLNSQAKKWPLIEDHDKIIETAKTDIDKALQAPEGELYVLASENKIKGTYVFDISIREKGRVSSVNIVERIEGNIPDQNRIKDAIKDFRLSFKMPKGKSYKFRYTFSF
ncbi:MAG: hypothetical protein U5Q03_14860 [Bacteroidota bacterium]|nr:hypothetical protein [Bacteroidota bacterium]